MFFSCCSKKNKNEKSNSKDTLEQKEITPAKKTPNTEDFFHSNHLGDFEHFNSCNPQNNSSTSSKKSSKHSSLTITDSGSTTASSDASLSQINIIGDQPTNSFSLNTTPLSKNPSGDSTASQLEYPVTKIKFTNISEDGKSFEGDETYKIEKLIAQGSFGEVYYLKNKRKNSLFPDLIAKVIPYKDKNTEYNLEQELYNKLRGTSFSPVKFSEYILKNEKGFLYPKIAIFTYYYPNKDLLNYMIKLQEEYNIQKLKNSFLSEKQFLIYALQIIEDLEKLHELGYTHNDLKLENFMIDKDGKLVLIDFGLARKIGTSITRFIGSKTWGNLEFLGLEEISQSKINFLSSEKHYHLTVNPNQDIFGLGLLLYSLRALQTPFKEKEEVTYLAMLEKIKEIKKQLNSLFPENIACIIGEMLNEEPTKRPSLSNLKKNFLKIYDKLETEYFIMKPK